MFEDHIFFKNADGVMYGVSPRVIEAGFTPEDSHVEATLEEKEAFIQQAEERKALGQPKTLEDKQTLVLDLRDKGMPTESIKLLLGIGIEDIPEADLAKLERLRTKQAAQKAAKEAVAVAKLAEKQRLIEESEAARLAAIEAERQAEIDRQAALFAEQQAAREVLRQAAIEVERQAEADRQAIIEAERQAEVDRQSAIDAELQAEIDRQAAIEAETARLEAEKQESIDKGNMLLSTIQNMRPVINPETDKEGGTN